MKKTTEQFIQEAIQVHNNKYDYSKVEYVNSKTKVCIICPIHGEFWQTPLHHLNGSNCPKCTFHYTKTTQEFIDKAKEIHGNKYDYSKVEYINSRTKVCIICTEHGEFWQIPTNHLQGKGCKYCGGTNKSNIIDFINKAHRIHKNKYDYSKTIYTKANKKVTIICPKHGVFQQEANSHLQGAGCPHCNESHLENQIRFILDEDNIDFEFQKKFNWLGQQSLDFYLPEYNIAIECQGKQHFGIGLWIEKEGFETIINRDKKKKLLCEENGIKMLYYTNLKCFNEFLGEKLIKDKGDLLNAIKIKE